MAEPNSREEDGKDSQGQDNHELKSPATDKGNASQPPPLSHAAPSQEKMDAKGDVSEDDETSPSRATHEIRFESANLKKAKNKRGRKWGKTIYCGIISPRRKTPRPAARSKGDYLCIICESRFTRAEGVNFHFPSCVERCGNPQGNHWNDHPSCARRNTRGNNFAAGPASRAGHIEQKEGEGDEVDKTPRRYDPRTIATDILRAVGEHPTLPPLNAHMYGFDQGFDLVPQPYVCGSLRLRDLEASNEATDPSYRNPLRQYQRDDEVVKLRTEQEAIAAERKIAQEKEEAKRMARIEADDSNPMTTPRPSQMSLSQNPSGNSILNQTHPVSQPQALPGGWEMRVHRNFPAVYFVNRHNGILTLDDPRAPHQPRPLARLGGLPNGWEIGLADTRNGPRVYFIDHNNGTTSWNDPRGPPS